MTFPDPSTMIFNLGERVWKDVYFLFCFVDLSGEKEIFSDLSIRDIVDSTLSAWRSVA